MARKQKGMFSAAEEAEFLKVMAEVDRQHAEMVEWLADQGLAEGSMRRLMEYSNAYSMSAATHIVGPLVCSACHEDEQEGVIIPGCDGFLCLDCGAHHMAESFKKYEEMGIVF
jgi:hypothetical protein